MSRRARLIDDATFRRVCRARDYGHVYFSEQIDTEALAREAALSMWHFHRLFTAAFGVTPHDFLTGLRIERAKRLLAAGSHSVTEVCLESGYTSLGSFSMRFRSRVGRSPSEYQREMWRVFGGVAVERSVFIPTCFLWHPGLAA